METMLIKLHYQLLQTKETVLSNGFIAVVVSHMRRRSVQVRKNHMAEKNMCTSGARLMIVVLTIST